MNKFLQLSILNIFLLLSPVLLLAQAPEIEWERCIGGKNNEQIADAGVFGDSCLVFCGSTWSCNGFIKNYHDDADIYVAKINKNGSIEWSKTLGGNGYDI